jgi:hypothetical protein
MASLEAVGILMERDQGQKVGEWSDVLSQDKQEPAWGMEMCSNQIPRPHIICRLPLITGRVRKSSFSMIVCTVFNIQGHMLLALLFLEQREMYFVHTLPAMELLIRVSLLIQLEMRAFALPTGRTLHRGT